MSLENDKIILRDLATQYAEIAKMKIQDERRELWRQSNSLEKGAKPLILVQNFGGWSEFMREKYSNDKMKCEDIFFKQQEAKLRILLWQHTHNDDKVEEPWLSLPASHVTNPKGTWGLQVKTIMPDEKAGAFKEIHPIGEDWEEMDMLEMPRHKIDEKKTKENYDKINSVIGDILEVDSNRTPVLTNHEGSIAMPLGRLRGIEDLMYDIFDSPDEFKKALSFFRDATLKNQQEAEDAGDFSLTSYYDGSLTYFRDTPDCKANTFGVKRKDLLAFCQAQEYTMFSPEQHDEFMLQYQIPIMENFKHITYGCCEDLSEKIDMLKQVKNLRMIGVTPFADVARCAEQIGDQYVVSYRPNPALMVCNGFDESRIRRIIGDSLKIFKANNCTLHISLKDVETLEGDWNRLGKWTTIVRDVIEKVW